MACSSCGKKLASASFGRTAIAAPTPLAVAAGRNYWEANPDLWAEVEYQGSVGNHFIPSPNRRVRHYGYGGRGVVIPVHIDDIASEPALFIPTTLEGAIKVWPSYPAGAPAHVVGRLGLPQKAQPAEPQSVGAGDTSVAKATPEAEGAEATAVADDTPVAKATPVQEAVVVVTPPAKKKEK